MVLQKTLLKDKKLYKNTLKKSFALSELCFKTSRYRELWSRRK